MDLFIGSKGHRLILVKFTQLDQGSIYLQDILILNKNCQIPQSSATREWK